jgi:hypothetical protein
MSVKLALEAIENILNAFDSFSDIERVQAYATIKVLTNELAEYAESHGLPHGLISEKIVELIEACRALAHLSNRGDRDNSWYLSEAYGAIMKLRSSHCFKVERE